MSVAVKPAPKLTSELGPNLNIAIHAFLDYTMVQPVDLLLQIGVAGYPGQAVSQDRFAIAGNPTRHTIAGDGGVGQRAWLRIEDQFRCDYKAKVLINRPNPVFDTLAGMQFGALDGDTVGYLMPSRYCFPEDFIDITTTTFAGLAGGVRVAAMAEWIGQEFTYDPFASHMHMTATESLAALRGVCRDYAHVLIAMCRAVGTPARIVSVYAPNVTPQDFHAVVEVYLAGAWHLIDPTGMAQADEMAVIGVGRDAADISFMTSYGFVEIKKQTVTVSQV